MPSELLLRGEIFEISREETLATCAVINRADITPETGARCAIEMRTFLIERVLKRGGPFTGLVFDVRRGPPAFGPKTRAELELIFGAAQQSGRRAAVLVGESPTQRMQFTSLARECAPDHCRVFDRQAEAEAWARGAR